jgi:hypothetical protein
MHDRTATAGVAGSPKNDAQGTTTRRKWPKIEAPDAKKWMICWKFPYRV